MKKIVLLAIGMFMLVSCSTDNWDSEPLQQEINTSSLSSDPTKDWDKNDYSNNNGNSSNNQGGGN